METIPYTVHASRDQAERWEMAAAAQGRMAIGTWLASTAYAYLRELVKAGRPLPLAWWWGRFRVVLTDSDKRPPDLREEEVAGLQSDHFGFRGDRRGPGPAGCSRYSLVHRPTRRIIATLAYR